MNIRSLLGILTIGFITSCSTSATAPVVKPGETHMPDQSRNTDNIVAVTDGPCFYRGTMYSDGAASCQSGVQYRCNIGEWVSLGSSCTEETVTLSRPCQFSGVTFPTGAASCQAGTQYRCEDGSWTSLRASCGDSPIRLVPGGRTCMLDGGSTVATSSSVCRSGSTFLCNDGEWVNLGTLCR